jgi:hypothetical protein
MSTPCQPVSHRGHRTLLEALLPLACGLPLLLASAVPVGAQQQGYGQTINSPQQERELDAGTGAPSRNSALDATNPIELMNRLRRASAFDNATPPSDAIDAALRDFQPDPAASGSGSMVAP